MPVYVDGNTHCAWCSAHNCSNSRNKCPNLTFFRFPKDPERAKRWVIASGREDLLKKSSEQLYRSNNICELHFEKGCFKRTQGRKLLNKDAVPTIFAIDKPPRKKTASQAALKERGQSSKHSNLQVLSTPCTSSGYSETSDTESEPEGMIVQNRNLQDSNPPPNYGLATFQCPRLGQETEGCVNSATTRTSDNSHLVQAEHLSNKLVGQDTSVQPVFVTAGLKCEAPPGYPTEDIGNNDVKTPVPYNPVADLELPQRFVAFSDETAEWQCDVKPCVTDLMNERNFELSRNLNDEAYSNETVENQCDMKLCVTDLVSGTNSESPQIVNYEAFSNETEERQCDVKPCVTDLVNRANSELPQIPTYKAFSKEATERQCDVKSCVLDLLNRRNYEKLHRYEGFSNETTVKQRDGKACDSDLRGVPNSELPQTCITCHRKQCNADLHNPQNSEERPLQRCEEFSHEKNAGPDGVQTSVAAVSVESNCESTTRNKTEHSPFPILLIKNRSSKSFPL